MKKIKALGIDLGNGFIKMVSKDKQLVEQAVFSNVAKTQFSITNLMSNTYKINNSEILIGQQAINSKLALISAVGSIDNTTRYASEDYFNLMFSFIALFSDTLEDVEIDNLVLGLPNNHFKKCANSMKERFENKKVIVNDQVIFVKRVEVIPQPLGTYFNEDLHEKDVLIIDLGQGTVDYTHINPQGFINDMFSTENGVKLFYLDILKYLNNLDIIANLELEDIPTFLSNGINNYKGIKQPIDNEVIRDLKLAHIQRFLNPAIQRFNYLNSFDKIIITGGGAEVYKENIQAIQNDLDNIYFVKDCQLANAKGFYLFAKSLDEEKEDE